jgi:SAM-dependent methyltransferase
LTGYYLLMEEGAAPAPTREWTTARVRRAVTLLGDTSALRRQWRLRAVKPRFGLETVRDFVIDERYGGRCGGTYQGRWGHLGYRGTSSAHYYYLGKLFSEKNVPIGPDDVLVDVGCGKGRVLNFWLHKGLRNRMVGIEIDERWATFAAQRLTRFKNIEVICGDAFEATPAEGTIFYIFNPFTEETCGRFKEHLESLCASGATVTLVYYMCNYARLFRDDPRWEVSDVKENTFHPSIVARYSRPSAPTG